MPIETRLEVDGEQATVVKLAWGGAADRLGREAARLAALDHPGLVEVVEAGPFDGGFRLRTAYAGQPVGVGPPLNPRRAGALVAAVAEIVADLHDAGTVHGTLDGHHVVVGPSGLPRLCGLGDGTRAGGEPATPADDVAALGALLVELLGRGAGEGGLRAARWRGRASGDRARRLLLELAGQAMAEPPTRRPSARRLAAELAALVPGELATSEATVRVRGRRSRPARRHRAPEPATAGGPRHSASTRGPDELAWRLGAAGAAGLVVLAAAGIAVTAVRGSAPSPAAPPPAAAAAASPLADRAHLAHIDGTTVDIGGQRFEVGIPGDVVVVGDWDCDGSSTAALLRPATGEVFLFPSWVAAGEELAVGPVAVVAGARTLHAVPRDGCHELVARAPGGTETVVTGAGGRR